MSLESGDVLSLGIEGKEPMEVKNLNFKNFQSNYLLAKEGERILRFAYNPKKLKITTAVADPATIDKLDIFEEGDSGYNLYDTYLKL